VNPRVRFEDEAEAVDAVDATIDQIAKLPRAGAPVGRLPPDLLVRRAPVKRFPTMWSTWKRKTTIRVLAIAHERRKPGYWKSRL
jgi:toxin ParE1/3/4